MASTQDYINYVLEQINDAGNITCKKMFGEHAIYVDHKVVALICDNQLFVKPTEAGRKHIGDVEEAPPYPGAKMSFLIGDKADDKAWLCQLIRITADELPESKPKKKKSKEK